MMGNQHETDPNTPVDFLLVEAAKQGEIGRMRTLLANGANPACWVREDQDQMPLVRVVARMGQIESAALLMAGVNDEAIERTGGEDWRANYALSPLIDFVCRGASHLAERALTHCMDTMTQKQWGDLLFHRLCYAYKTNTNVLIDECVGHLDQQHLQEVERRAVGLIGARPDEWYLVEVAIGHRNLKKTTPEPAGPRRPINRM